MKNYKERETKIIDGINHFYEVGRNLRSECRQFIVDFVKEYGEEDKNGRFTLYLYNDEYGEYLGNENICCTYDGGNHPEYDANPFSTINTIHVYDGGRVFLDTEDTDGYDIDFITTDEMIAIAEYFTNVKGELDENRNNG